MNFDLTIDRHIAAPPEKVWEVMTGRLTEWWCPKPWTTTIEQLEWKSGGVFHLTMRGPNGETDCQGEESIPGVLLEFTPGKRFVFTFRSRRSPRRDQTCVDAGGSRTAC